MGGKEYQKMNMGSSHKTKATECPTCKQICNGVTQVSGFDDRPNGPKAGDVTICSFCLEVCEYTEELNLIVADQSTFHELDKQILDEALKYMQSQKRIH